MFSAYKRMLETTPANHPPTKYKIAFLTGLSNPRSCAISKVQKQFLNSLELPEIYKLCLNFPYIPADGEEDTPLWKASFYNTHQFFSISSSRALVREHLLQLTNSTEKLALITGSCGLEILNVGSSEEIIKKILHVYALGPVAWQKPDYPCTLIQGSSDYISKLFFRKVDLQVNDIHHMNYLENKSVFDFINQHSQQSLKSFSSKPL